MLTEISYYILQIKLQRIISFLMSLKEINCNLFLPGGLYHNVTTSLEYVLVGTDLARASPKSAN